MNIQLRGWLPLSPTKVVPLLVWMLLSSGCFLFKPSVRHKAGSDAAEQPRKQHPEDLLDAEARARETQGQYVEALAKRDAAIALRSERLGPADSAVGSALLDAGDIAWRKLQDRERALAYLAKTVLPSRSNNPFARLAGNLMSFDALLYMQRAKLLSSLGMLPESDADIARGRQLSDHGPGIADLFGQMALMVRMAQADVYVERGTLPEALKVLNEGRVNVFSLMMSARLKAALGDASGALEDLELSAEGVKHDLERALSGKHREEVSDLAGLVNVWTLDQRLALALATSHPELPRARLVALWISGEAQGRAYDASGYERAAWFGERERVLANELQTYRAQLAAKYLSSLSADGRGSLDAELTAKVQEHEVAMREKGNAEVPEISSPEEARAALKMFLAAADRAEFPRGSADSLLRSLSARLGTGQVLVNFVLHDPADLTDLQPWAPRSGGVTRYAALALRGGQAAADLIDLGEAPTLDEAIANLRNQLHDVAAPLETLREESAQLRAKLWQPLGASVQGAAHVHVVPDGALQLLPLGALYDPEGQQWLAEQVGLSYVDSLRWLLPSTLPAAQPQAFSVVMANPLPPSGNYAPDALQASHYPALPGVEREAKLVQTVLGAEVLVGAQAHEANLRSVERPSILHIASHALMLEPSAGADDSGATRGMSAPPTPRLMAPVPPQAGAKINAANVATEDMMRVALVLGPPQPARPGGDACCDSFMTAYELAALDLHGTQLVTLSACETGLGRALKLHGVSSLRRALMMAGAQSVVASLWKVSDDSTTQLMGDFYTELKRGVGRSDALRHAMATVRAQKPHPYHWAAFTLSGSPGPLAKAAPVAQR